MVSTVLRFVSIALMICTSIYSLIAHGAATAKQLEWFNFGEISGLFGNTVFIFIVHHSVSGIIYPIRPQKKVKPMFMMAYSIGTTLLLLEGFLAALAFGGRDRWGPDPNVFPCSIQKLYNENFLKITFVGQFTNFYPMLNVSAVPVLVITLRNNLF